MARHRTFNTARSCLPLVALLIAAALVVAWLGRQPPNLRWTSVRLEPQNGTNAFELAPPGGWDGLELAVSYHRYHSSHIYGRDRLGKPVLAASEYSYTSPHRSISTFLVEAATAETVAMWPGRWLVCPISPQEQNGDLLLWFPEAWYERASPNERADVVALFRHNYARDFKLLDTDVFTTAIEAAARGERLAVYSRLAIVGPDGEEKERFAFDPRFTADDGFLYETPDGRMAIVETDGGYQNSDLFYLLFSQDHMTDGEVAVVMSSEDIEGSYRGFFLVDIEGAVPLWYRRMGVTCIKNHVVDLDRDGVDEILLEAYAANNGISGAGMTDAESVYLICLDQGGNIIWKKRFLGVFTGTQAAAVDLTGDGTLEVVTTWSSGYYEDLGGVAVLSADGRTLSERRDLGGLYGMAVADFDGDGAAEIAAGGPQNRVYLLDWELEVEMMMVDSTDLFLPAQDPTGEFAGRSLHGPDLPWRRRVMPIAASDMDGDGMSDLIALQTVWHRWDLPRVGTVLGGRGDIVVFNGRLEELARAPVDHRMTGNRLFPRDAPASRKMESFPLDVDGDGLLELMVGTKGAGLFAYRGTNES